MIPRLFLLIATLRHLRLTQVYHQVLYRLKKPGILSVYKRRQERQAPTFLEFIEVPPVYKSASNDGKFEFLNIVEQLSDTPDWNFQHHGKLWNYNLQYGNYLLQNDISLDVKLSWLRSIYNWLTDGRLLLEPYPVSLRSINAIRLFSSERIDDQDLLTSLYAELGFLSQRPEYHLMANHLLENAFALMMGGAFFNNHRWLAQGEKIIKAELSEQILKDGGHFELSPMYHQIIFFRLLEFIDWYSKWEPRSEAFEYFMRKKASDMLSWLTQVTFSSGDIPHFNDSAPNIAFSTAWLSSYAAKLEVPSKLLPLSDSGYRKFHCKDIELVVDVAKIGPSYQAGHGHADALSFVLYYKGKPIIVDGGTSTYEGGKQRDLERSTSFHNTVTVGDINQSQVYGAFRTGDRAKVKILDDAKNVILAEHNGYKKAFNIIHRRFIEVSQGDFFIKDTITPSSDQQCIAYFHFHPDLSVRINNTKIFIDGICMIFFDDIKSLALNPYNFARGFNQLEKAFVAEVAFKDELITRFDFLN